MAKANINVSQAIRDYHEANPDDKPKAVVAGLKAQGIKVNSQYVSMVLSNARMGKKKSAKKRGRKPVNASNNGKSSGVSGLAELRLVKELVTRAGSIEGARQVIDDFSELVS